jgi:hypothetical protein
MPVLLTQYVMDREGIQTMRRGQFPNQQTYDDGIKLTGLEFM